MSVVLTAPPAKTFTPEDLLRMPDHGRGYELVDGELKEPNTSFLANFVAGRVANRLANHVEPKNLGWVSPQGTSYRCFLDDLKRVRLADVGFHRLDQLTAAQARAEGHCTVVPELVVEVISPNDLADEVNAKRLEWLEAGAQLVWVILPIQQTIHAYHADGTVSHFRRTDILVGEPVLPGFRVPVADLFKLPTDGS